MIHPESSEQWPPNVTFPSYPQTWMVLFVTAEGTSQMYLGKDIVGWTFPPIASVHPHKRKTGAPARGVGPWMLGSSDTVWGRRSPGDGYNLEHMNTCQGMNACQTGGLLSPQQFLLVAVPFWGLQGRET